VITVILREEPGLMTGDSIITTLDSVPTEIVFQRRE
jgi:hypothetical protein